MVHSPSVLEENKKAFDTSKGLPAVVPKTPGGGWKSEEERQSARREIWANALAWVDKDEVIIGGKENRVVCPLGNLLM